MNNKKEVIKVILLGFICIALVIGAFGFSVVQILKNNNDVVEKKKEELTEEELYEVLNKGGIVLQNPNNNNVDVIYNTEGEKVEDWDETVQNYLAGQQSWYKDEDGIIYFEPETVFTFDGLEYNFASKEDLRYMQFYIESEDRYDDYIVVPVTVTNKNDFDMMILPTQIYYRGFTPYYCDEKGLVEVGISMTFENDLLSYPEFKPGESKDLFAYIPYVGDALSLKDDIDDINYYYQIMFRYINSTNISATVAYKGPIKFPVNEHSQKFTESSVCEAIVREEGITRKE